MAGESQDRPLSVSSLTMELKDLVERRFSKIYVEGEISGWRPYPSGHVYFTLKDGGAQVQCVMFRSSVERCRVRAALKDGAKVLVYANATVYPQRGNYQLVVLAAKLLGEGDLMQRYLALKAKLEAEGLFDPSRKRPLPFMPRRVALVTSPAGAVVHDMCRVLTRRFPNLEIRIHPAVVQGAEAPRSVAAGLARFNAAGDGWVADVIIVARGGGSFEDLFCFSDESLVRAVAASRIPVISAVGHETDFTLCDFAADVRAGTPSIAAEIAVPEISELRRRLARALSSIASSLRGKYEWLSQRMDSFHDALGAALKSSLADAQTRLAVLASRMTVKPAIADAEARLKLLSSRLTVAPALAAAESRLGVLSAKLSLLSPYSVLERGYSLTTDATGRVVRAPSDAPEGSRLTTRLASGSIDSIVVGRVAPNAP